METVLEKFNSEVGLAQLEFNSRITEAAKRLFIGRRGNIFPRPFTGETFMSLDEDGQYEILDVAYVEDETQSHLVSVRISTVKGSGSIQTAFVKY